jgi:hypothetical protein
MFLNSRSNRFVCHMFPLSLLLLFIFERARL